MEIGDAINLNAIVMVMVRGHDKCERAFDRLRSRISHHTKNQKQWVELRCSTAVKMKFMLDWDLGILLIYQTEGDAPEDMVALDKRLSEKDLIDLLEISGYVK
jgi:hypothetical protein